MTGGFEKRPPGNRNPIAIGALFIYSNVQKKAPSARSKVDTDMPLPHGRNSNVQPAISNTLVARNVSVTVTKVIDLQKPARTM